jgi:hypothetical protein
MRSSAPRSNPSWISLAPESSQARLRELFRTAPTNRADQALVMLAAPPFPHEVEDMAARIEAVIEVLKK